MSAENTAKILEFLKAGPVQVSERGCCEPPRSGSRRRRPLWPLARAFVNCWSAASNDLSTNHSEGSLCRQVQPAVGGAGVTNSER